MIQVNQVSKKYGEQTVISNLSLNIPKGKITSFIGPNGAGKSTLLSMISRLTNYDSGSIFIEGVEIADWNPNELAKKISILKQTNHINIRLKVIDLVSFGRFPYSQGKLNQEDWEYINNAIAYMRLEDIREKYLDQLSGGQRQRAYIAMVIAQNTEYILLDEPLNNLDMKHSIEMMTVLRDLVRDFNKTILIVVHDINIASTYSDCIVALKDGEVVQMGTSQEIIEKTLLDSIYEMNFKIECLDQQRICIYY
jgi:iron complex transport system ATP-binding protein